MWEKLYHPPSKSLWWSIVLIQDSQRCSWEWFFIRDSPSSFKGKGSNTHTAWWLKKPNPRVVITWLTCSLLENISQVPAAQQSPSLPSQELAPDQAVTNTSMGTHRLSLLPCGWISHWFKKLCTDRNEETHPNPLENACFGSSKVFNLA